jgi:soluble lytic murein transglycosylase-like protein
MAALRVALAALALFAATPAGAQSVSHWRPHIEEASARFGVPVAWIERVMRAESGGLTVLNGRPITSHAGAMGLMQIMPGTWADLRARLGLGTDPHHPRDNIMAGAFYLRLMYDRFGYPGMFAAYNAGPGRFAEHLRTGRSLPSETRAYLATVAGQDRQLSVGFSRRNDLFVAIRAAPTHNATAVDGREKLFFALSGSASE